MKVYKNATAILVPAEIKESSVIMLGVVHNHAALTEQVLDDTSDWMRFGKPRHICIFSNEEVLQTDFKYHYVYHVDAAGDEHIIAPNTWQPNRLFCKKIIGTTDRTILNPILNTNSPLYNLLGDEHKRLPTVNKKFAEVFVKSYLEGKKSLDIVVEYETNNVHNQEVMFHQERKEYFFEDVKDGKIVTVYLEERLNVTADDNAIIAKSKKTIWDRDEVVDLLYKHTEDMLKQRIDLEQWISENLIDLNKKLS